MSRTLFGLALASLIVMSGNAFADSFTFLSPGSVTWNGVYVNPYQAQDNTHTQNNPLTIYCDDWNTDFSGTPTWTASVYTLTAGNVSNFKYGTATDVYNVTLTGGYLSAAPDTAPNDFQRYLEVAYLDDQLRIELASGATSTAKQLAQQEISAAEWTLFVDTSHVGSPLTDPNSGLIGAINNTAGFAVAVSTYLTGAHTAVTTPGGYTAPGWDVIVPEGNNSNGGPMQEFLVYSTPEPSAVILLGTVIGYLGLTKFRRRRQA
jgi:hypothetical protein